MSQTLMFYIISTIFFQKKFALFTILFANLHYQQYCINSYRYYKYNIQVNGARKIWFFIKCMGRFYDGLNHIKKVYINVFL